jgi:hypothetical protein
MTTSIHEIEGAPRVLSYASRATPTHPRRATLPWFALSAGVLAWVPVFLSVLFGSAQALWVAPSLGFIGLLIATISVIDPASRSSSFQIAGGLALLSTLAGIFVAISALID